MKSLMLWNLFQITRSRDDFIMFPVGQTKKEKAIQTQSLRVRPHTLKPNPHSVFILNIADVYIHPSYCTI